MLQNIRISRNVFRFISYYWVSVYKRLGVIAQKCESFKINKNATRKPCLTTEHVVLLVRLNFMNVLPTTLVAFSIFVFFFYNDTSDRFIYPYNKYIILCYVQCRRVTVTVSTILQTSRECTSQIFFYPTFRAETVLFGGEPAHCSFTRNRLRAVYRIEINPISRSLTGFRNHFCKLICPTTHELFRPWPQTVVHTQYTDGPVSPRTTIPT